ncbi:hypothetical protein IWX91DRAFT_347002 [Phyllosticta citricarpa]
MWAGKQSVGLFVAHTCTTHVSILSRIGHGRWVHGLSRRAKCDGQGSNFNRRQTADCTKGTWDGNDGRPCVSAVHVCMRVAGASQAKAGVGAWLRGCVLVSNMETREGQMEKKNHGRRGEAVGAPKRADVCAASRGRTGATISKKRAYGRERHYHYHLVADVVLSWA